MSGQVLKKAYGLNLIFYLISLHKELFWQQYYGKKVAQYSLT